MLGFAEAWAVLVGLQPSLQGIDFTAPETAQDTGLQTARLHCHTICTEEFTNVIMAWDTEDKGTTHRLDS